MEAKFFPAEGASTAQVETVEQHFAQSQTLSDAIYGWVNEDHTIELAGGWDDATDEDRLCLIFSVDGQEIGHFEIPHETLSPDYQAVAPITEGIVGRDERGVKQDDAWFDRREEEFGAWFDDRLGQLALGHEKAIAWALGYAFCRGGSAQFQLANPEILEEDLGEDLDLIDARFLFIDLFYSDPVSNSGFGESLVVHFS